MSYLANHGIRKFLTLNDFLIEDVDYMVRKSYEFKTNVMRSVPQVAKNGLMVLYFEKKSTRTRLSCTRAWTKLGGTVIDMSPQESNSHIKVNESIYDSFRVIAGMADCIVARVNDHSTLEEIARACEDACGKSGQSGKSGGKVFSPSPSPMVINALSDKFHPLQILADLLTMYEASLVDMKKKKGEGKNVVDMKNGATSATSLSTVRNVLKGTTVTWIGDSNNVFNSLITTLPRLDISVRICVPPRYPPKDYVLKMLLEQDMNNEIKEESIMLFDEPQEALEGARFVITDTWVSMGDEKEKEDRMEAFKGYQVNMDLVKRSKLHEDWRFMHCMPRKKEEVTDDVFYSDRSLVFEEAENRMWTAMALFYVMTTTRL